MYADRVLLAETLIAVFDTGSFTGAAERLGISQSTVSRRIAALEMKLGGKRMFERGGRSINPTQAAENYIERIRSILISLDAADAKVSEFAVEPEGLVRLSLPPALGRAKLLLPLAALQHKFPKLDLRIDLSEGYIDLHDRGFDIVVRIKELEQTGIDQVKLGQSELTFVGASAYFERHALPTEAEHLKNHDFIGLSSQKDRGMLSFGGRRLAFSRDLRPRLFVNDVSAIYDLVLAGFGLSLLPEYLVGEDLKTGRLIGCDLDIAVSPISFYALYPRTHKSTPNINAVLEVLKTCFTKGQD